jgi:hypothetical protein
MAIMLKTDGTLLCDPSAATPPTSATLTADIDAVTLSIPISAGDNVINGTYVQIGTERILIASGAVPGPCTLIAQTRGAWGTTAITHSNGATIHLPGGLTMMLLPSVQVPNQSIKIRKSTPTTPSTATLSDINFVLIVTGGTDVFPGGSTSRILPDSTEANGMVTITFPGAGTPRVLMVAGGSGPPGPPGGGGTPAPAAISATGSIVNYQQWANATQPVFGGVITLPITDPAYSHDVILEVFAQAPSSDEWIQIARYENPFTGSTLDWTGSDPYILQTDVDQPGWKLKVIPYNESYAAGPDYDIPGTLTIAAAGVLSVTAAEASGSDRYIDENGGYHTIVNVTVTLANGQVPQVVTIELSFDGGTTWHWSNWYTATTSPFTIPIDCWLPTSSAQVWKAAASVGAINGADPALPTQGAFVQSSTFTISPITLSSVYAQDNAGSTYRWKDPALHTVISFTPVQVTSAHPFLQTPITVWINMGDGNKRCQGVIDMTSVGQTLYVGSGPNDVTHVPSIGTVFPPTTGNETWAFYAAAGKWDGTVDPTTIAGYASCTFTAYAPAAPGSTDASGAYVDEITYSPVSGGGYNFGWNNLFVTLPLSDPNFHVGRLTVQNGAGVGAAFVPSATGNDGTERNVFDWSTPNAFDSTPPTDPNSKLCSGGVAAGVITYQKPNDWPCPNDANTVIRLRWYDGSLLAGSDGTDTTFTVQNAWIGGYAGTPYTGAGNDYYYDIIINGSYLAPTSNQTQEPTAQSIDFDTSAVSGYTTTLSAAITDTASQQISATSGANVVNNTYIQIGSERMFVLSGGGTNTLQVSRGAWGTTAATHLNGATVDIPGARTACHLQPWCSDSHNSKDLQRHQLRQDPVPQRRHVSRWRFFHGLAR